jgi:predicted nucleotidyltransferase
MLSMEDRHWKIVADILAKYPYTFYAFGSRAKGNPQRFSDLDLCYCEDIPVRELACLKDDFEESNLPYKVDLVNWKNCNDTFRSLILKDLVLIQGAPEMPNES